MFDKNYFNFVLLAQEIVEQLQAALDEFRTVEDILVVNDD